MTIERGILGLLIIVIFLIVAWATGIACIEFIKFPAPKYVNKNLAALVTGMAVILITAFTIAEFTGCL